MSSCIQGWFQIGDVAEDILSGGMTGIHHTWLVWCWGWNWDSACWQVLYTDSAAFPTWLLSSFFPVSFSPPLSISFFSFVKSCSYLKGLLIESRDSAWDSLSWSLSPRTSTADGTRPQGSCTDTFHPYIFLLMLSFSPLPGWQNKSCSWPYPSHMIDKWAALLGNTFPIWQTHISETMNQINPSSLDVLYRYFVTVTKRW